MGVISGKEERLGGGFGHDRKVGKWFKWWSWWFLAGGWLGKGCGGFGG